MKIWKGRLFVGLPAGDADGFAVFSHARKESFCFKERLAPLKFLI